MLKKISLSLLACSTLICLACTKKTGEKTVTLVMAEVNPAESFVGRVDAAFKEKAEELSGGSIIIDISYSAALGNDRQVMDLVKTPGSIVQLVRSSTNLSSYSKGLPLRSALLSIPYTFRNDEHFWRFARSELAEEILDEPYRLGLGIKGLFFGEEGQRHFFSPLPIKDISDLRGKTIRVSGNALKDIVQAFGGIPVDLPFPEMYTAMHIGSVEIADQPLTNYLSNGFHKVAPYMICDGHMIGSFQVIINAACWDSLSQKQQQVLKEAGAYASEFCRKTLDDITKEAVERLEKEGAVIIPLADNSPWQEACVQIREKEALVDPVMYRQILAF